MIFPHIIAVHHPQADQVMLDLSIPADHPAFAGHFPQMPVLPGVVQTDWAVRLADRYLMTGCAVSQKFQVKFRRVIQPGPVQLTLRLDRTKGSLSFEYVVQDAVASTGRMGLEIRQ